ncbi:hypothetical protein MPSEU_000754000 [Mayamaea pseudoterrestris]|nr:hypothetical protein MPSEU_000754000 [Mayamaea pseudoterrestris]
MGKTMMLITKSSYATKLIVYTVLKICWERMGKRHLRTILRQNLCRNGMDLREHRRGISRIGSLQALPFTTQLTIPKLINTVNMSDAPVHAEWIWSGRMEPFEFFQTMFQSESDNGKNVGYITLYLDEPCLNAFSRLTEEAVSELLTILESAPIVSVDVESVSMLGFTHWDVACEAVRLCRLCQTLGSKPSLKRARFIARQGESFIHGLALRELQHLTEITMFDQFGQIGFLSTELAYALQTHPHLKSVTLEIQNSCISPLLTALQSRSSLELHWANHGNWPVLGHTLAPLEALQAFAQAMLQFSGHLSLSYHDFSGNGCSEA